MNTAMRLAVMGVAVATLALGGCRGATPTAAPSTSVSSVDPMGSVETRVDQIEKQVDQDGTR